uniref:Uncharacterized protein n=1 Tax=Zea mays TaxID=4577 RepID=B4FMK2_MAIZE|nr:unknown [Zea mays]
MHYGRFLVSFVIFEKLYIVYTERCSCVLFAVASIARRMVAVILL